MYLATLRARLRTPETLLGLCPSTRVAQWCGQPIDLGHPGWHLRPLVVDPGQVPAVTDPAEAGRSPELAVLSALAHSEGPERDKVLPEAARHHLEELMTAGTYEYRSDFARKYARILACTDTELLNTWIDRAIPADTADELFA